ncbi:MAG: hypothetical protein GYB31_06985 [Bacteroidetes bacterium]|nr:hypothetical protein [Bacteroidota bacterium]
MRIYFLIVCTFGMVSLWSCHPKSIPAQTETEIPERDSMAVENMPETLVMDTVEFELDTQVVYSWIKFARTACYGECPVFDFEILSDGSVFYHGHKHVLRSGYQKAQLSSIQLEKLVQLSESLDPHKFASNYPEYNEAIPDLPEIHLEIFDKGKWKSIRINHFPPLALMSYIDELEELMDSLSWTSYPDPGNKEE